MEGEVSWRPPRPNHKWVRMDLTEDYRLEPVEVAKTLLVRAGNWDGADLRTPTAQDEQPLFTLRRQAEELVLDGPLGRYKFEPSTLEPVEPDPLWESAEGICRHMDEDHSDTYEVFLRARGWDGGGLSSLVMPWVEQRGFFLSGPGCLAWVPFAQNCPTPNDVRKTLIKMLKEIRRD